MSDSLHGITPDTRERSGESKIPDGVTGDGRVDGLPLSGALQRLLYSPLCYRLYLSAS